MSRTNFCSPVNDNSNYFVIKTKNANMMLATPGAHLAAFVNFRPNAANAGKVAAGERIPEMFTEFKLARFTEL